MEDKREGDPNFFSYFPPRKTAETASQTVYGSMVATLLRGMGYYTPFVAPQGKDGGVDVIAYRDPLGTVSPRIKVQIKHRESPASVQEVRQLMGLLQKDGDVGIFVQITVWVYSRGYIVAVELRYRYPLAFERSYSLGCILSSSKFT